MQFSKWKFFDSNISIYKSPLQVPESGHISFFVCESGQTFQIIKNLKFKFEIIDCSKNVGESPII